MKKYELKNMTRGWFVGNFAPTCLATSAAEVGVKEYKKGYRGEAHFHKVATEATVIISGRAEMNGISCGPGDILVVEPGETADFSAESDVVTVVVKVPGAPDDKFTAGQANA